MRIASSWELPPSLLEKLKRLNEEAHGHPFLEDWDHALGGMHFFVEEGGEPVSHASVVERLLQSGGVELRTGYVEAVATRPDRQRRGLATRVMRAATDHVLATFELGALSTGEHGFYARLGWERWQGPTFVRTGSGPIRTGHEDGNIMVLRTPRTPEIDVGGAICCDWRSGDVW